MATSKKYVEHLDALLDKYQSPEIKRERETRKQAFENLIEKRYQPGADVDALQFEMAGQKEINKLFLDERASDREHGKILALAIKENRVVDHAPRALTGHDR